MKSKDDCSSELVVVIYRSALFTSIIDISAVFGNRRQRVSTAHLGVCDRLPPTHATCSGCTTAAQRSTAAYIQCNTSTGWYFLSIHYITLQPSYVSWSKIPQYSTTLNEYIVFFPKCTLHKFCYIININIILMNSWVTLATVWRHFHIELRVTVYHRTRPAYTTSANTTTDHQMRRVWIVPTVWVVTRQTIYYWIKQKIEKKYNT